MNAAPPLLSIRGLTKQYGAVSVLSGLDLDVSPGDRIVVIGPSGGGKSTLLRCAMGLETIQAGSMTFEGAPYISARPGARTNTIDRTIRRRIGMVFQHYTLFPHLSVMQNLLLAPVKSLGKPRDQEAERAKLLLDRFGLAAKASAYPSSLSGGQKQRVAIARALMLEPKLMLFDEVTSALDPELVREVEAMMMQLAENKLAMLIVTHDMRFARRIATRIIFCADGKVLDDGKPEELLTHATQDRTRRFLEQVLN